MKGIFSFVFGCAAIATLLLSCSGNDYRSIEKKELASGERHDSLFMGFYLGMTMKDFYAICWEMNKEGTIRQGSQNLTVQYKMEDELKAPAFMDFYPEFVANKISEMPVTFKYEAWAPWNQSLSSDSLQLDVVRLFEEWYGKGFMEVEKPESTDIAFVKVDGNRRITVYKDAVEGQVKAWFVDLAFKKQIEEAAKEMEQKMSSQ